MAIDREKVLEAASKFVEKKRYDKAIVEYQKLIESDPNDARTLLKMGDLQLKMAAYPEAITTYERVELRMPRLVKKDGSRTDFDRDKLLGSMMVALRKRPVATEAIDAAVDRIEEKLRSLGDREVLTSRIGDLVMRELAKLDKIAYIRFASVYRSFETPDDFREAVQEIRRPRRRK